MDKKKMWGGRFSDETDSFAAGSIPQFHLITVCTGWISWVVLLMPKC